MSTGKLALGQIQLGDNVDTSKNYVIKVPAVADGTLVIERGNGTDVLSIDASGKLTFTAADTQLPLGVEQTWQDVTASRATDTTYTNSTGRSICVSIATTSAANGSAAYLQVNGVEIARPLVSSAATTVIVLTGIVPPGATYLYGGRPIGKWTELR